MARDRRHPVAAWLERLWCDWVEPYSAMIERRARAGHARSQLMLGHSLEQGSGRFPQDLPGAERWLLAAAAQGHPGAFSAWRILRETHYGDPLEAFIAPCLAHMPFGDPDVGSEMMLVAHKRPDCRAEIVAACRPLAERGVANAQYVLSEVLERDDASRAEAHRYRLAAARAGHPAAITRLGVAHLHGRHGPADARAAVRHWRRAWRLGDTEAGALLAESYFLGQGVRQDEAHAMRLAREVGPADWDATAMLAFGLMTGRGVDQDEAEAFRLALDGAKRGAPRLTFFAAKLLAEGRGVDKDAARSDYWLDKAIALGQPEAFTVRGHQRLEAGERVEGAAWLLAGRALQGVHADRLDALDPPLTEAERTEAEARGAAIAAASRACEPIPEALQKGTPCSNA